jgi:hypothetical protein
MQHRMESPPGTRRPLATIPHTSDKDTPGVVGPFKEIGEYVAKAKNLLRTKGWHRTCLEMRGKRSDITADVGNLPHRAAPYLHRIGKHGAPVVLQSPPWDAPTLDARFARGPHQSAHDHVEFLGEEFLDFLRKGYWMLVEYDDVKNLPGLRLSPIGVVPQRERRPRVIVDYSFFGVNRETLKLALQESMQFGKAVERMTQVIVRSNPAFGPCRLYKGDMSDGFYRIGVTSSGSLKLAVLLPRFPGMPPMVAIPLVLPMGWTDSPPYFSMFTETVCDLTNEDFRKNKRYPAHPLEKCAGIADFCENPESGPDAEPVRPTPWSHAPKLAQKPTAYMDVFVDDFCGIGQDSRMNPLVNQRRALLHNIDKVFRQNDQDDNEHRKAPISISKLQKGDASFHTKKKCLGWDFGGNSKTLYVAKHRHDKALTNLENMLLQHWATRNQWEKLLGELRSLVPGIPGSRGCFSFLQEAMKHRRTRVKVGGDVRTQLETFLQLLLSTNRPTHMEELVRGDPRYLGTVDAAKSGMGGVWFPEKGAPIVWREPFSPSVQREMVSQDQPDGTITNSDLELTGTIAQHMVLANTGLPLAGETTHAFCDNTPAVAWQTKGSTTTARAAATLLQEQALHQRQYGYLPTVQYLDGPRNKMADDASRRWDLSDTAFLAYFTSTYPQTESWQLLHLRPEQSSVLTSHLLRLKCNKASHQNEELPKTRTGQSGKSFVTNSTSTPGYGTAPTQSPSFKSSCNASTTDASRHPASRSQLDTLRTSYGQWARRFPQWGPLTRGSTARLAG